MFDLNDPDMQEIVVGFCDECDSLLENLEEILDNFDDDGEAKYLEEYGQVVDRMMGAAQTLGIESIGKLCHMGKVIGYKSAQCGDKALQEVSAGILLDLTDLLTALVLEIRDPTKKNKISVEGFLGRLKWLSDKFKHIERASCSFEEGDENSDKELDDLISVYGDSDK